MFGAISAAANAQPHGLSLKYAPKWLRRPVTASFGFGGQLVSTRATSGAHAHSVTVRQIRTEPHIAARAQQLGEVLDTNTLVEYCQQQSDSPATMVDDVPTWKALQTLFQASSREELVALLGFSREDTSARAAEAVRQLGEAPKPPPAPEAQLFGGSVEPTFLDGAEVSFTLPEPEDAPFRIHAAGNDDPDRDVTRALVLGDFESAVALLVARERFPDALILAARAGDGLLEKTQRAYFARHAQNVPYLRVLQSIVTEDLRDVVANADLAEWQEIFVVLCTFAKAEDFNVLTERLGERLEREYLAGARDLRKNAVLCYLAAGKLDKVVGMWIDEMKEEEEAIRVHAEAVGGAIAQHDSRQTARAEALQSFMEKVAVFQAAVSYTDPDLEPPAPLPTGEIPIREFRLAPLYDYILEYVDVLAEQGLTELALRFIAQTPADYAPSGDGADSAGWVHDRLLGSNEGSAAVQYAQDAYAAPDYSYGVYGASAPSAPPASTVPNVPTVPSLSLIHI